MKQNARNNRRRKAKATRKLAAYWRARRRTFLDLFLESAAQLGQRLARSLDDTLRRMAANFEAVGEATQRLALRLQVALQRYPETIEMPAEVAGLLDSTHEDVREVQKI